MVIKIGFTDRVLNKV